MMFPFTECCDARNGAATGIGLSCTVERRRGARLGLALGVSHRVRCRLMMKLRRNGLGSRRAALLAGCRVPDLPLKLRDLHRARPAISNPAAAKHSNTGRGDEQANIGGWPK
jgi:hypothetical protein